MKRIDRDFKFSSFSPLSSRGGSLRQFNNFNNHRFLKFALRKTNLSISFQKFNLSTYTSEKIEEITIFIREKIERKNVSIVLIKVMLIKAMIKHYWIEGEKKENLNRM